jgi:ribosomal protein S18 acetylase RimI-like enzyme
MTRLVPLPPESFVAFIEAAAAAHAEDNVRSGRWPAQDAPALARAESARLLPGGVATPGHQLFRIDADAEAIGFLWLATLQHGSAKTAYVYQIIVAPEHRRRGHARAALQQAAALAAAQGHSSIALHVFAFNEAAQALYRSLGYQVVSLNMALPLTVAQPAPISASSTPPATTLAT